MSFGIPVRNGLMLGLGASTALSTRAGAKPAMFLNFLQPFLDSRITFSRGTGATRVNQSGFIETVGNTTPRFDYDPVTLAPRGLLIEEARTNLLTYSEQFDNAAWTKASATVTANVTTSPDGTVNADKVVVSNGITMGTSSAAGIRQTISKAASAITYTYTAFAKAGEFNSIFLFMSNAALTATARCVFNLAAGTASATTTVGAFSGTSATITSVGNGWYRCSLTTTTDTDTSLRCDIWPSDTVATTGNGTSGIFAWGADLEAGSFATSYIPTVASTATRNADVATMTGTNFSSWYNQSEGTFVAAGDTVSINNAALFAVGSTASDVMRFFRQTDFQPVFQVVTGGVAQATIGLGTTNWPQPSVINTASAYATNNFAATVNGITPVADTLGTVPTVAQMSLGSSPGLAALNGHIRTIAYFNTRLPNAQLQTLTAPSLATTLSLDFTTGSYNVGF